MNVRYGEGKTKYGPGVSIDLDGDEIAVAISAWLVAHGISINGPRTITVNGDLCKDGKVYVDPSGFVISGGERFFGCGQKQKEDETTNICDVCAREDFCHIVIKKPVTRCSEFLRTGSAYDKS